MLDNFKRLNITFTTLKIESNFGSAASIFVRRAAVSLYPCSPITAKQEQTNTNPESIVHEITQTIKCIIYAIYEITLMNECKILTSETEIGHVKWY